ncbi:GNAT family N-acetyltransferase [Salinispirillum marinum]|uniref:GNAT family N-acetyltransferase n=2 Tax=Saccharospirillaceae TaxID=255527 RepID=A0ABV8BCU1_9GAMM
MSNDIATLRSELPGDAAAIHHLTEQAFAAVAHSDHNEHHIVAALRTAQVLTLSMVAVDQGQLLGHVAISPVTLSSGDAGWYGLGPVSVHPDVQRRGIGSALISCVLSKLQGKGAKGCVVLGDPAYYRRFGFAQSTQLRLPGVPAEYFLVRAFGGEMPVAEVQYHPAFSATA